MELQDWRKEPRKNYSNEFKLRMVELASQPGACVAQIEALKLIGELYAIEHEIRGLPVSERLSSQIKHSPGNPGRFTLSKKCRLRDAFRYIRKHWVALCNFCDDGLAEADNNTAE
ncbi:transposase IS66 family protein, partial [Escherichia coli P0305260.7]